MALIYDGGEVNAMAWKNPCLSCGACCAFFRVPFYWAEANDYTPGGVPVEMSEQLDDFRLVMRGTRGNDPRCICLQGTIGQEVFCSIYEYRPTKCREFTASWADGEANDYCTSARKAYGLGPLTRDSWKDADQS